MRNILYHRNLFFVYVGAFLGVVLLGSCSTSKGMSRGESNAEIRKHNCEQSATIELSENCGVLIRLSKGGAYQVTQIDDVDFYFTPGDHVWVTMHIDSNVTASCEGLLGAARITCAEAIPLVEVTESVECYDVMDVLKVPWMNDVITTYNPSMVIKHTYQGNPVYSFKGQFGQMVYSCKGKIICRTDYGEPESCKELLEHLENKTVLLKVDY